MLVSMPGFGCVECDGVPGVTNTCCDPVEGGYSAKGGEHPARQGKHGLVEGGEQGAKDDHASRGKDVSHGATDTLGEVAQELGHCLEVADLHGVALGGIMIIA